jgi:hypothetical protein
MSNFVVNLVEYVPPARSDGRPFTEARIEEAATAAGEWAVIEHVTLEPLDSDPLHPEARTLTTAKAQIATGFYRVVWLDKESAETQPTTPVQMLVEGGTRPAVADVAALIRARTKVAGGREVGTFTNSTRPTGDQVDTLIEFALDDVLGKVATPEAGSVYEARVRGAVALYAAVLVETSYFPEQVGAAGKSASDTLMKLYESRIRALIAEGETGEPQGEGTTDAPADPYWSFPADVAARW